MWEIWQRGVRGGRNEHHLFLTSFMYEYTICTKVQNKHFSQSHSKKEGELVTHRNRYEWKAMEIKS
jgi:hypothetical protein